MKLYGAEILKFNEIYTGGATLALAALTRNSQGFFTKNDTPRAIEGVTQLLGAACQATNSCDSLARIRDFLAVNILDNQILKP